MMKITGGDSLAMKEFHLFGNPMAVTRHLYWLPTEIETHRSQSINCFSSHWLLVVDTCTIILWHKIWVGALASVEKVVTKKCEYFYLRYSSFKRKLFQKDAL